MQTAVIPSFSKYVSPTEVAEKIPAGGKVFVASDKDGTMDHKIPNPDHAFVGTKVNKAMLRLSQDPNTRFAIVSGREVEWLEKLGGPIAYSPAVRLCGGHGHQKKIGGAENYLYHPGVHWEAKLNEAVTRMTEELSFFGIPWKTTASDDYGLYIEMKPSIGGFAIHWRTAMDRAEQAQELLTRASKEFLESGTHYLLDADCVLELKLRGRNKGNPVAEEIQDFLPDCAVFLGDDHMDLDMIREALKHTPNCFLIFVGDKEISNVDFPTDKIYRVKDPHDVAEIFKLVADKRNLPEIHDITGLPMHPYYRLNYLNQVTA